MMQIFDIATGELTPDTPPRIRVFAVVVKEFGGHYTDYVKPDELDAFLESHDVQDVFEETVPDPDYVRERRKAFDRIWSSSCLLPPTEDLQLLIAAKRTAPEEWETIDPQAGKFSMTRKRLELIRNEKMNAEQTPTP